MLCTVLNYIVRYQLRAPVCTYLIVQRGSYICNMAVTTSYPKEKIRILFLENISDIAVKNFRRHGYVQVDRITKALSEDQLAEEIKNVHILGIRSKTQITRR